MEKVLFVVGISLIFLNFFPTPNYKNGVSIEFPVHTKTKSKLIFMLIDGLRFNLFHHLNQTSKILNHSKINLLEAHSDPPTVTMPRIKSLTSGVMPCFLDVLQNLNSQEFTQDNILYQLKNQGKRISLFGDETWNKLYPSYFHKKDVTTSFFVTDTKIVDDNVTRNIDFELNNPESWDVMILHYLGLDHVGHLGGIQNDLFIPKMNEMDQISIKFIQWTLNRNDTIFILCSDHGMKNDGSHGGNSKDETSSFLMFVGQEYYSNSKKVKQLDFVPTISSLLGIPIPLNNIGILIPDFFKDDELLQLLKLNSKQIMNLLSDKEKELLKNEIESLKNDSIESLKKVRFSFECNQKFLKKSQGVLRKRSYFQIQGIVIGIILCIISTSILFFYHFNKPKNFTQYFLLGSKAFYLIGMSSSSFIEEEHQYWYYFTATLFSLTIIFELLYNGNIDFKILLILWINRILKAWNSSGDKWKGEISTSNMLDSSPFLLIILSLFCIISLMIYYIIQNRNLIERLNIFILSSLLILFKIFVKNSIAKIIYYQIFFTIIISTILKKKELIQFSFYILLLLIHKNNQSFLIFLLIIQSKISREYQKNFTFHYFLFQNSFYHFGRSVSITSIDFNGAYTGLNDYHIFLVGFLLILIIYSGPIIYLLDNSNFIKEKFHLKMLDVTIIGILLFLMREHLFIWSVFSPKFLFEIFHLIFIIFTSIITFFH